VPKKNSDFKTELKRLPERAAGGGSSRQREVLLAELKRHNHHMTNVARALGLERSHLYKKCQQLGIDFRAIRKTES